MSQYKNDLALSTVGKIILAIIFLVLFILLASFLMEKSKLGWDKGQSIMDNIQDYIKGG